MSAPRNFTNVYGSGHQSSLKITRWRFAPTVWDLRRDTGRRVLA